MKTLIKNSIIIKSGQEEAVRGDIAVEGSIIKHVGAVPESFQADEVIDGGSFIAMPGLVNAHTHSPMGILRNLADDLPFSDWLFGKIIPSESKLTEDDVYWGSLLGIVEMIKSGVTCFADMYLHIDAITRAISESAMRANISFGPIQSDVRGNGLIVETEKCSEYIKKWNNAGNGKIKSFIEIHSVYLYDKQSITDAALLAKELGTGIHIHLSESLSEIQTSYEKYGVSPVRAAYNFGVFEQPVLAAHCVHINKNDVELLFNSSVSPVHCPSSNLKLGNGVAPVPLLLDLGSNVCLGTDGSASNNNLNMFEEMHLAALIHKGWERAPEIMSASAVLDMATINGAKALGFESVGKIEEGYKADIILIDTNKPHICPLNDAKAAAVYSVQASDVDTVMVDGKILLRGGKLVHLDEELIMGRVAETAKRIK